ncbi:MAG: catalase family peroxidase [Methylotenera sp.]|uniref:catalase family peroxidase n=1 Tax=Methylotenera sp. TaxID=2051956 RepID=UPI00184B5112|nr:catalase family peroxidase [Methylotenera sp.]NOU24204.1 catalase family peroxidase [Methylotenera sp.]
MSKFITPLVIGLLVLVSASKAQAEDVQAKEAKSVVEQIVDVQTKIAGGPHKGFRANHAKGIVATGVFTPAASAASLTNAAHLQKTPSEVIVRFSNATGIPTIADVSPKANPRGISIRFKLPDNQFTDIVSLSVNRFPVATPEAFLAFLQANVATKADSPKPTPIEQFLEANPSAKAFVKLPKPAPASYANQSYFGLNAFKFTNAKAETRYGRYQITPLAGNIALEESQVVGAAPNYLSEELATRLKQGEASFRISVQLANEGDNINDPTAVWPDDRTQVELGTLTLKAIPADGKNLEQKIAFNPLNLVDGIAPSEDKILLARPAAYAVSVSRR